MLKLETGAELVVDAGPHPRAATPVEAQVENPSGTAAVRLELVRENGESGEDVLAQFLPGPDGTRGTLTWLLPAAAAGEMLTFRVSEPVEPGGDEGVTLEAGEDRLHFFVRGHHLTSYHFGPELARPYCHPLLGPGGAPMTNLAPADHPHHKSVWVAHGEVNGHDNWSEAPGHARTVCRRCEVLAQGPVCAELAAQSDWETAAGEKLLTEESRLRVYNLPGQARLLEWAITLRARYGGVFFGDTKEAGILSVRVAESMEGSRGGRIVNACGAVGEGECWGRPAPWVDYSGPVEGRLLGLAIFDHPANFRYPTPWHVRDYGLFTANSWGLHDFTGDWALRGDCALPAGQALCWRFRLYLHEGDEEAGEVAARWLDFAYPPRVREATGG